jgi:hypothetical protein
MFLNANLAVLSSTFSIFVRGLCLWWEGRHARKGERGGGETPRAPASMLGGLSQTGVAVVVQSVRGGESMSKPHEGTQTRQEGGVEPLALSCSTDLKSAPPTEEDHPDQCAPATAGAAPGSDEPRKLCFVLCVVWLCRYCM